MSKLTGYFKKIILGSMFTLIFFGSINVFAQTPGTPASSSTTANSTSTSSCNTWGEGQSNAACKKAREDKLIERASFLDDMLKAMYLLIRPIIMISGLAIDNKLVFGESIGLDLYLRKFWTIMMVIAYMGLAISLLITVYEGLKEGGDKLISKLKETGKKAVIAAILIPMSWFLVQQLVNLSTLLTFSVGALPLYVNATSEPDCTSPKAKDNALCTSLLQTHTRFNLTDVFGGDRKSLALYSTRDPSKDEISAIYLQCPITSSKIDPAQHTKMIEGIKGTDKTYDSLRQIATTMIMEKGKTLDPARIPTVIAAGSEYCVIKSNTLIKLSGKEIGLFTKEYGEGLVAAADVLRGQANTKIHSILELNKSAIGPLYAIYGSILDFGSIGSSLANNPYPSAALIESILKAFQGFMLFIPLVGFAIVMVVRMGYLWVIIGFSPLIVLVNTVFKDGDAAKKVKEVKYFGSLGETLNRVQIAKLIMQPTIVMFALSIGLIFLAIIQNTLSLNKEAMDFYSFGIQMETNTVNQSCFDIMSLQTVCLDGPGLGYGLGILSDLFNRGILNIIGIMVVWGLFFMALKSNKITQAVAESVEKIAENYVGTREIIPIGDKKVGFMAAQKGIQDTIETITKTDGSKQYENVIKPETERFADTFAGKKSDMNSSIRTDLGKAIKENEGKGEFNDTGSITKAIDGLGKNTSYSISDIDSGKGFRGQEVMAALTEKNDLGGYYHADKGSKKYSEIKGILDGKKVGLATQDWESYSKAMQGFYDTNKKNTIEINGGKLMAAKDRIGKNSLIKFETDTEGKLTQIESYGSDLFEGYEKATNKNDMISFINEKFNKVGIDNNKAADRLLRTISNGTDKADINKLELNTEQNPDKTRKTPITHKIIIDSKGQAKLELV